VTSDSIPSNTTFCQMIQSSKSSCEKKRISYVVDAVTPNDKCFVTAAMAATDKLYFWLVMFLLSSRVRAEGLTMDQ
jgi:hypothetical protein